MKPFRRIVQALLLSLTMLLSSMIPAFADADYPLTIKAISTDYPPQLMNIAAKDNATVLTENGTTDGASLTMQALGSTLAPSWRFDRVGTDSNGTFFKLTNAESGRLITPKSYNVTAGNSVIMYGSELAQSQHWYVIPVSTDRLGNSLHYKIVNYSDTSLALTQGTTGMTLENYTGAANQQWLLNADGLQGFAGYCFDDTTGKEKAADIGGLFGEVVEVTNFNDLKKYATADEPYTIVVTKNISVTELNMNGSRYMCTAGRIYVHSNKTIIGSYAANTLFNVQFCTSTNSGTGNNIIIKNFDMQHDAESNNNDSIVCYFGSGQNIWVDHVTFTGHNGYGSAPQTGQVDEDKFLACCYDADYCTVSDSSFGAHKYGLILGYPADGANEYANYNNFPRMSIIGNHFNDTNTRGPGLMRWGYFHCLNNYVNKFSMAYTVISNCKIFAENSVYENGGNVICDWDKMTYVGMYSESGSLFSNCKRTQQGGDSNSTALACSWRPKSNYSYIALSAENAKNYTGSYSGEQSASGNMMYLRFANKGVPSAGFVTAPSGKIGATLDEAYTFRFKNVNSGLYLEVANGIAENGANVQQGTSGAANWKLVAGDSGYYRVYSQLGDGKTYLLDLVNGNPENGTNIGIWTDTVSDAQQFKFVDNGDGTYTICTKATSDQSCIGVNAASIDVGANVLQWSCNDSPDQKWILEMVLDPIYGNLIQSVVPKDASLYSYWAIDSSLAVGDQVFGDRTGDKLASFMTVPEAVAGAELLITPCDAKTLSGDIADLTAGDDITLYIGLDTRTISQFGVPAWMNGFIDSGMTIANDREVTFALYAKEMAQGETITLGANGGATGCVFYTVLAMPKPVETTTTTTTATTTTTTNSTPPPQTATVIGDVNCDGDVKIGDVILLNRFIAEDSAAIISAQGMLNAEVNGITPVNGDDSIAILRMLAGIK